LTGRNLDCGYCEVNWSFIGNLFRRKKGETTLSPGPKCSFCGKEQKEVQKLIAGPELFICNECNDLSEGLITEQLAKGPKES